MENDTPTSVGTAVSVDQLNPIAIDPKMPMTDYTRFMALLETTDACSSASVLAPLLTIAQRFKKDEEVRTQMDTVKDGKTIFGPTASTPEEGQQRIADAHAQVVSVQATVDKFQKQLEAAMPLILYALPQGDSETFRQEFLKFNHLQRTVDAAGAVTYAPDNTGFAPANQCYVPRALLTPPQK